MTGIFHCFQQLFPCLQNRISISRLSGYVLKQCDDIMCILTCDQSLSSLKAVHLKYSFSRIWRTGGELLFLTQAVWLDFELFRLKKIDCCKRLRQENRKFASLDSYCKRKKSFVFVKKKKCSMTDYHHTSYFSVHKSWPHSTSSQSTSQLHRRLAAVVPKMLTEPWQQ